MRSLGVSLLFLAMTLLSAGCSSGAHPAEAQPSYRSHPSPVINTTTATPGPYTEMDGDGRGELEMNSEGCIYLAGPAGLQDLVWPSNWSPQDSRTGVTVTNTAGAKLRLNKPVLLVGSVRNLDEALQCHVNDGKTALYVSDFVGKTTGGG